METSECALEGLPLLHSLCLLLNGKLESKNLKNKQFNTCMICCMT